MVKTMVFSLLETIGETLLKDKLLTDNREPVLEFQLPAFLSSSPDDETTFGLYAPCMEFWKQTTVVSTYL
jgi:hypothetical protein